VIQDIVRPGLSDFNEEQCRLIHNSSLEILRRTGIQVHHPEALALLAAAGAQVDETLVRLPPDLVESALTTPPSALTLCVRGTDEPALRLAGRQSSFGPGSDCPNFLDPAGGIRRRYTRADLASCYRLVDSLPEMGFLMSMGIPADIPGRVYQAQFALMLNSSRKPIVFVCDDKEDCRVITAMAAAVAGGEDALALNPNILLYSEPSTPLQHSGTATGKLLFMAEHKLPIVHSPAPMMGGTAPYSLAAGLALGNAEVLSSLVIHQLKSPGAPFVYGSGLHHMDMRSSISVYGAPEFQLARLGVAALARFYGLPSWGYAGHTDSCLFDGQAASDALFSVLVALMSGTNLIHDVGYVEAGLTTSPEMIVYTCEMIGMLRRFQAGLALDAEALALKAIQAVGPGGNFLMADHTLRHLHDFWQPALQERGRYDAWQSGGGKDLSARVREKTLSLLSEAPGDPLPDLKRREVAAVLKASGLAENLLD
jgi:trimethylamine--corrinoid protein Co-methyltransferase